MAVELGVPETPGDVDVVIVTYNSAQTLAGCLDSVQRALTDRQGRVIVVDNASGDESAKIASTHPLRPLVIVSESNQGFALACNLGFRYGCSPTVLFLNPDASLEAGALSTLIEAISADNRLAAVGPRIDDPRGEFSAAAAGYEPTLRSVLGHFLGLARFPWLRHYFRPVQLANPAAAAYVDWVSGGAMLVRREAFEQVGGFAERFFLYMEDVDLCRRLRTAGWKIHYLPSARVTHAIGGSQPHGQVERWYRAFYAYLAERQGEGRARMASAAAALGFAIRWLLYRRRKPRQAVRMREGASIAIRLALWPRHT